MSAARKSVRRATDGDAPGPRGEDRAAFLLEEVARLMAEKGYHETSMRDVAAATGYSLAGLYHHFASKEDLLYRIQHRVFSELLEEQEESLDEAAPLEEQLAALVCNHLAYFAKHTAELKVCTFELQSLSGEAYEAIEDLRRRYYQLVAGVVERLLRRGGKKPAKSEVRHLTLFAFGMINWMFMWFDPERDRTQELADELVHFVLHGIESRPSAPAADVRMLGSAGRASGPARPRRKTKG